MSVEENSIVLTLQAKSVAFGYPRALDEEIWPLLAHFVQTQTGDADIVLRLRHAGNGTLELHSNDMLIWSGLTWPAALHTIMDELERAFAGLLPDVVVRGGAVRMPGASSKSVLITGPRGGNKTELTSWFLERGFTYLADNFVGLCCDHANITGDRRAIAPLALPLAPHAAIGAGLLSRSDFGKTYAMASGDRVYMRPRAVAQDHDEIQHCDLIIVPTFYEASELAIELLQPQEARFQLIQSVHPEKRLTPIGLDRVAGISQSIPAISVRYGSFDQLGGGLETCVRAILDGNLDRTGIRDFLDKRRPAPQAGKDSIKTDRAPSPLTATVPRYKKQLTIGMATYDDYDGVYFTLQSMRMANPGLVDDIEFVVVDNNPDGPCGTHLKAFESWTPNYRYIPIRERSGTAVRDFVMAEASSEFVMCLDCHVLLAPGALERLFEYIEANPRSRDLLQGPMLYDNLISVSTHMDPVWREGMYGVWGVNEAGLNPNAPPFDIPMHGLGLYVCRREAWPGYNPHFCGFGGEEGYIHEKFRQAGGRTLCLPFLRWLHRFARPLGVPYRVSWRDRIRNYLLGFDELGLPVEPVIEHFSPILGLSADALFEDVRREIADLRAG